MGDAAILILHWFYTVFAVVLHWIPPFPGSQRRAGGQASLRCHAGVAVSGCVPVPRDIFTIIHQNGAGGIPSAAPPSHLQLPGFFVLIRFMGWFGVGVFFFPFCTTTRGYFRSRGPSCPRSPRGCGAGWLCACKAALPSLRAHPPAGGGREGGGGWWREGAIEFQTQTTAWGTDPPPPRRAAPRTAGRGRRRPPAPGSPPGPPRWGVGEAAGSPPPLPPPPFIIIFLLLFLFFLC